MNIFYFKWGAKVERGQQEFNNISSMIKKEMEMFEAARVKEFKSLIIRYLEDHMAHQAQVTHYIKLRICYDFLILKFI